MKKKVFSILLCGFLLLDLTGCGSKKEKNYDEGKLALNDERIQTIIDEVLLVYDTSSLSSIYNYDVMRAANSRVEDEQTLQGIKRFDKVVITSHDKEGNYNYYFYGKIYGVDEYNKTISRDIKINFYCDDSGNNECKVTYGGFSIKR